jgi:hypothetical protein
MLTNTTLGAARRLPGDIIVSTIKIVNTGVLPLTDVAILASTPVRPANVTRTWTSTFSVGVGGVPPASGVGSISAIGISLPPGGELDFTTSDTVPVAGSYTNVATASAGTLSKRSEGQTVTLSSQTPGSGCGAIGGPCSPWITPDELSQCCGTVVPCSPSGAMTPLDRELALQGIQMASEILYNLSARVYSGCCEQTIRPCNVNTGCCCSPAPSQCGCSAVTEVYLGSSWPVREIREVKVDGVNQNLANYHINDRQFLAMTGACGGKTPDFPCCQDMNLMTDCPGTWSVTFTTGMEPPAAGKWACAQLACEIVKSCKNDASCALPQRIQTITRQGVSVVLAGDMAHLEKFLTGIPSVDLFLTSHNPHKLVSPPFVWSPDLPQAGRKLFT